MKENITIDEMLKLSKFLYEKHKHEWREATPESNIYWIGWIVGEIGEVLDIIKKKGVDKIMNDEEVRGEMLKEITDCFMYLADILNRYQFSSEEFSKIYFEKMNYNLSRDYGNRKTSADKAKEQDENATPRGL